MTSGPVKQVNEPWLEADARITSCELVAGTGLLTDVYVPSIYRVAFTYLVDGQEFAGSYGAESPAGTRFYHQVGF